MFFFQFPFIFLFIRFNCLLWYVFQLGSHFSFFLRRLHLEVIRKFTNSPPFFDNVLKRLNVSIIAFFKKVLKVGQRKFLSFLLSFLPFFSSFHFLFYFSPFILSLSFRFLFPVCFSLFNVFSFVPIFPHSFTLQVFVSCFLLIPFSFLSKPIFSSFLSLVGVHFFYSYVIFSSFEAF